MRIKFPFEIKRCCRLRLFDKTTLSFIGNQLFCHQDYRKLRHFADQYATFTSHCVAIVCVDETELRSGSWQWIEIYEVC